MKDGEKSWMEGDSQFFHLPPDIDPMIDTRDNNWTDLKRRGLIHTLTVSFELFSFQW
jgi:uncharacterized OB-fold protein